VRIVWTPPWVFILVLFNLLVMAIVALVMQKKAKITYSLTPVARAAVIRKRSIGFFLLLATVVLMYFGFTSASEFTWAYLLGGVLSLIVALVFFIIADSIKAVKHRDGWFRLKGCSKEFLATLPVGHSPF